MRWGHVTALVGLLTFFVGLSMILPLGCSLYFREGEAARVLLVSMGITLGCGALLYGPTRKSASEALSHREGMAIVTLGWISVGVFGAIPFHLGDVFPSFVDSLFESVSGFTTTGSSLLSNIEALPRGLLLWRSLIQWLGGMGIIVLSLAILPFLGVGGMQLYKAEVPSPVPDKLKPRIRDTATVLWKVYLLFTAAQVLLLMLGNMNLFDAVCHAFTTMPTGGFSTRNVSVMSFHSAWVDGVMVVFMLLAGVNFSLHYQMLKGRPKVLWRDPEARFFLGLVLVLIAAVTVNVHGVVYESLSSAFRYASFQVVSILTTTGYVTADYERWPAFSQIVLVLCMFVGASAGSTGGGIKCLRVMLLFKYAYRELFRLVHPRSVSPVKLGGRVVPEAVLSSICGFFLAYVGLFAICSVLLSSMGVDLLTSLSAVAATMGNIGPGLAGVGPMDNFSMIPLAGKWLLIFCMLLGRLEIYTVIILLVPEFWRK
ncbi:MAG: TrkH family potassium uptake protein [Proteobacteria bacterium]|nr:TrkH family potassium uptake protein [Pseudomonadota bacterium]